MNTTKTAIETTNQIAQDAINGEIFNLKELVRKGIESYQGSPAKKSDKLLEAVAHSLDMPHYSHLKAELDKSDEKRYSRKYDIEIKEIETDAFETDSFCFINGQLIDPEIMENETVGFRIVDRYDFIERLEELLCDPISRIDHGSNYEMLLEHRKMIARKIFLLEDERKLNMCDFIITDDSSYAFVEFASKYYNTEMFDNACESILEENKEFAKTPRCPDCLADLTKEDSVQREYFNKHTDESTTLEGAFVVDGDDYHFESDENLSGTEHSNGWDCADDSDTCSKCFSCV